MAGGMNPMSQMHEVIEISDSSTENMDPVIISDDAMSPEMASLSQQPKPENVSGPGGVVVDRPFKRNDRREAAALRKKNRGKRPKMEDCHPSVVKIKKPPSSSTTHDHNYSHDHNIVNVIYIPEYLKAIGQKCWICKMDMMFSPEIGASQPTAPPPAAILDCGHTFHNYCLMTITPVDQQMDPPCPPCSINS